MEPPIYPKVAQVIRAELDQAGISQRKVVDATGTPLSTMNRKVNGHQPFDVEELWCIARMLDKKVSDLTTSVDAA